MPLQPPVARAFLTRRTITCEGFHRDDGLLDVDGHLVDIRGYATNNPWRGDLPAGSPMRDMWVRLTIDDELNIVATQSASDAAPYPTCGEINSRTERLIGLKIIGGFKRKMHELVGNTEGCTHVVALLEAIATVAIHAVAGTRRGLPKMEALSVFGVRNPDRPALIDTCHSYAADSPIVAKLWPLHFRPKPSGKHD